MRRIARELGISRHTVKKYCLGAALPWERKTPQRKSPVITSEVLTFIKECLEQDAAAPRKQHHTGCRIFERLRDELGFKGSESTVRHQVALLRKKLPKVYIPLCFSPAEAAQIDWGVATAVIGGLRQKVQLFCFRLCFSCAPFVVAFPSQKGEAFLEGHQLAFEYFDGVPKKCIYDNLKTAVKEGWGKHAKEQPVFNAFVAHHAFEAIFCNLGEGHEKGLVESLVGWARRNILVPVPKVKDFAELNQMLLARCQKYLEHTIRGHETSVGEALALERGQLTPLPIKPYDPARLSEVQAGYFSTVPFDANHYSVPVELAGEVITVKGYGHWVKMYHHEKEVAVHERVYGKSQTRYQLAHYLRLLEQRPRAVGNARPVRDANLPHLFWEYAGLFPDPDHTMVRLLRLVVDHGVERVEEAIVKARTFNSRSLEVVIHYLAGEETPQPLPVRGPRVEAPDLARYDGLLLGGAR